MKEMVKIIGGAALLYVVIVMFIAVLPAIELSRTPAGPDVVPLTPLQARGRQVFAANGCAYCHTQQVRPTPADANLGRPMAPGDFAYRTPVLAGSERTGPDLTNVGTTRGSDVWQYIHLYDPRAVEPASIMPNFKFLFRVVDQVPKGETAVPVPAKFAPKHGHVIPTADAKALVAYLLSLKQAKIPGYNMHGSAGGATTAAPATGSGSAAAAQGAALYTANCAACHQANGEGLPGAFPPLKGNPVVLAKDASEHIGVVLHGLHGKAINGVAYGGAMPPFAGTLSDAQIAAIIDHERTSWGNAAPTITPADVKAVRAGKSVTPAAAAPKAAGSPEAAEKPAAAPVAASGYQFDAKRGDSLYASTCAACHQATGEGLPGAFPPLKGNPVVLAADPAEHIDTILHGAHGKTIEGHTYASPMPPFGGQLDDEQVADIANHERTSWGNAARQVTPVDVARIRARK